MTVAQPLDQITAAFDSINVKGGLKSIIKSGTQATYTFAYPKIFLRPSDVAYAEQFQAHVAALGVIGVNVDFSQVGMHKIRVVCDELVLIGGHCYWANNKQVEIVCRKLSYLSGPTADPRVMFELSVPDQQAPPPLTLPPYPDAVNQNPSSLDCAWPGMWCTEETGFFSTMFQSIPNFMLTYDGNLDNVFIPAKQGAQPGVAQSGVQGVKGCPFTLSAETIDSGLLNPKAKPVLHIRSRGGTGGRGQTGGNGAEGGSGFGLCPLPEKEVFSFEADLDLMKKMAHMIEGGKGGNGGYGGPGGQGGEGGDVSILCGNEKVSRDDLPARFVTTDLAVGPQGDIGENGRQGDRGRFGTSTLYTNAGYWKDRALNGSMGSDYDLFFAIANQDQEGYPTENVTKTNQDPLAPLSNDELRQKTPEHARQPLARLGTLNCQVNQVETIRKQFANETNFLSLFLQRLHFQHFVLYTGQEFTTKDIESQRWLAEGRSNFEHDLQWVASVMQNAPRETALQKTLFNEFFLFAHKMISSPHLDGFGNSTKFVQWVPNKATYGIIQENALLAQKAYEGIDSTLKTHAHGRREAQKLINDAQYLIKGSTDKMKAGQLAMKDAEAEFDRTTVDMNEAMSVLNKDFEKLRSKISSHVDISVGKLISTLGNIASSALSGPSSPGVKAAKGVFGLVKAVESSVNSINDVRKDLVYKQMDYMVKTGKELGDEVTSKMDDLNNDPSALSGLREQIVVNKTEFEKLYQDTLAELPEGDDVRASFRKVIRIIDRKSKALADYNRAFAAQQESSFAVDRQQNILDATRTDASEELSDDEIQALDQFSTKIYQETSRFALWALYNRARAYNCLSFGQSRVYYYMSNLHTFSSLTATTIQGLSSILEQDIVNMSSRWSRHSLHHSPVEMTLSDANAKDLLDSLRQTRSFNLAIDNDFFIENSNFQDENAYDIRLHSMAVHLHGAEVQDHITKQHSTNGLFLIHIRSGGMFRYRSLPDGETRASALMHEQFEFAPVDSAYSYKYDAKKDRYTPSTGAQQFAKDHPAMDIAIGAGQGNEAIPLQSPMGMWSIRPVENVNTTKVTKVVIVFDISYRVCY